MLKKWNYPFKPLGHKSIMLYLLFVTLIVIHALSGGIDFYRHRYWMGELKFTVLAILIVMLYLYVKKQRVEFYAFIVTLLLESELTLIVIQNGFAHYSTVYPMLLTFGFFFFFELKWALVLTLLHHFYWLGCFIYGAMHYPSHPLLHDTTALIGMTIAYLFMILFGLFYYLSTETTYRELERSNRQKAILLGEIHHRIKNNLNMMASVLGLQIINIQNHKSADVTDALLNAKLRIQAMAMVHESIYKQKNFDEVSFYNYIYALTDVISRAYNSNVKVEVEANHIYLPLPMMIHLGMIINELFTNSIKYAFKEGDDNRVTCRLEAYGAGYRLIYHENHNKSVDIDKMLQSDTLGIKLLKLTTAQIGGEMHVSKNDGLKFTITFPSPQMQQ